MIRDIALTVRRLRRSRRLATAAILTFALGIGANTAIFSVVYAVLLRPLAYRDAARLVVLDHSGGAPVAPATYLDWRRQARFFSDMGAAPSWSGSWRTETRPEAVPGLQVSANMFSLLGASALIGRTFTSDEDRPGHPPVVVLAWSLWKRDFGGRDDIVGRPIVINGAAYTVIGVMPDSFRFAPFWVTNAEMWSPLVLGARETDRMGRSLRVFARLRPGATIQQARAEMNAIMSRLGGGYPGTSAKLVAAVAPLNERVTGRVRPMLLMLLGAVTSVLLIACVN